MRNIRTGKDLLFKHLSEIALGFLIVISIASNILWIRADNRLGPEIDSKVYLSKTLVFMDQMENGSQNSFFENLQELSHGGRPPLYQLLSIPFIAIFGRSMDSGLNLNMLFQVLLLVSIFNIGKILGNQKAGLLAALLITVYPPMIQLSRIFRPNFAVTACYALSLWLLLILLKTRSLKSAWWFMISLGFGILIHPFMFIVLVIPVTFFSIYLLFFQEHPRYPAGVRNFFPWLWIKFKDPLFLRGFLPAIFFVGVLVSLWYLPSSGILIETLQSASSDELAQFRGFEVLVRGFKGIPTDFFWFLRTMPYALSTILSILFAIGLVIAIIKHRPQDWFALVFFAGGYLFFGVASTKTWMQFSILLPIMALISSVWLTEIRSKWLFAGLLTLTLVTSMFVHYFVTWGSSVPGFTIAKYMGAPLNEDNSCSSGDLVFCADPATQEDWHVSEFLSMVVNDKNCQAGICDLMVYRFTPDFSYTAFRLTFLNEYPHLQMNIPQETELNFSIVGFNYSNLLTSSHIIFQVLDQKRNSDLYHWVTINFLNFPPPSFTSAHEEVATLELPNGSKARLIRRTQPLSLQEIEDTIRAIDLSEEYTTTQYEMIAPYYKQAGLLIQAQNAYQKALEISPENGHLWFELAVVYDALGDQIHAARAYEEVVKLLPDDPISSISQNWLDAHP